MSCHSCIVCGNRYNLHYFPQNNQKRKEWALNLGLDSDEVKRQYRICALHFKEDCFTYRGSEKLNRNAVPSLKKRCVRIPAKISIISKIPEPPSMLPSDMIIENLVMNTTDQPGPATSKSDENIKPLVKTGIKRAATTPANEVVQKKKRNVSALDDKSCFQHLSEEDEAVQTSYIEPTQKVQAVESCKKNAEELEVKLGLTSAKLNNALENNQKLFTELVSVKEDNFTLKQALNELQIIYNENNLLLKKRSTDLEILTDVHEKLKEKCEHLEASVERMTDMIEKYEIERRTMHNMIQDLKGNLRVFCRVRPQINQQEQDRLLCSLNFPGNNSLEIKKSLDSINAITSKSCDLKQKFIFDHVFPPEATQEQVFLEVAQLVRSALNGCNVCVFAYGQTDSGKTFTMQGTKEQLGIIPKTIDLVYETIEKLQLTNWRYTVEASFLQIYNETIKNLLHLQSNINDIKHNEGEEITITNLTTEVVESASDLKKLMETAHRNRAVATTNSNEHNSRSHAVTKIYLKSCNIKTNINLLGSITLVDLAGSECVKTSSEERLPENKNINKSLSALGSVIKALHNKESRVPYRDSKLTFLLRSSLGDNSKTLMFVNISPFEDCYAQTVNSLRFAAGLKKVRKSPINKNKF